MPEFVFRCINIKKQIITVKTFIFSVLLTTYLWLGNKSHISKNL